MRFRARRSEEPEIMLIPMIDVMLVLLLFFVATTSFVREAAVGLQLPEVSGQPQTNEAERLELIIDAEGHYTLGEQRLPDYQEGTLKQALKIAFESHPTQRFVIRADARTPHRFVVRAMDAAGQVGISAIGIAALPREAQ